MKTPDLAEIDLFAGLPEDARAQLDGDCVWIEREPNFVVIDEERREPHGVFVLAEGEVEVYRRGRNEDASIASLQATACFGEFAAILGTSGSASVRTRTKCLLGEIPPAAFLALVSQYSSVCLPLLKKMAVLVRAFDEELLRRQPGDELIALAYYRYVVLGSL